MSPALSKDLTSSCQCRGVKKRDMGYYLYGCCHSLLTGLLSSPFPTPDWSTFLLALGGNYLPTIYSLTDLEVSTDHVTALTVM